MDTSPSFPEQCGNPDGMKSLAKYTRLPVERIQYHADSDPSLIAAIQHGVLFVMAFWSGGAVQAFGKLTETINRLDPHGILEFTVIDTDGAPAFYEHPDFKGKLHGWGETAWIKNGMIRCTSGIGYNPDCFEGNTKALLEMS